MDGMFVRQGVENDIAMGVTGRPSSEHEAEVQRLRAPGRET